MSIITFDLEADGLLRDATRIWCMSYKVNDGPANLLTNEVDIKQCLRTLLACENQFMGHNISGYDIPLLKKLYGIEIPLDKCVDTLILSQMLEPEEFQHSLESWGEYLGDEKIQNEDWSQYTVLMGERCKKDCDITKQVYDTLATRLHLLPRESVLTEMEFNRLMSLQEVAGWQFNKDAASKLIVDLDEEIQRITDDILSVAPKRIIPNLSVKHMLKKDGTLTKDCVKLGVECGGDFCLFDVEELNLNSVQQVKEYLLSLGWRPTEFNYKKDGKRIVKDDNGKPIVTSAKLSNLESLTDGIGSKISRRILLSHRRNQIRGWTERVREDGRLEAGGVSCSTNTSRVTHRNIVNVPKAADDIFLGKAMRGLFISKPGYVLIGADLDQLEARVAANYTYPYDDGEYADLLLKGDPHTAVSQLFGCSRAVGKQCTYALQYGAQIPKLASILGCSESRASFLWHEWWKLRSSLAELKEAVISSVESRGYDRKKSLNTNAYLKTIDRRPIFIRSWHSALNALIQSTGSILFKEIVVYASSFLKEKDVAMVGNFHDEVIFEAHPDFIDDVKNALTSACEHVNMKYKLKVPLTLDVRVGYSWVDTH